MTRLVLVIETQLITEEEMSNKFNLPNSNPGKWGELQRELKNQLKIFNDENLESLEFYIESNLKLNRVTNEEDYDEEYKHFLRRTKSDQLVKLWELSGLRGNKQKIEQEFYTKSIRNLLKCSLTLEDEFPNGCLPVLEFGKEDEVILTRSQVKCLLAHMFLCTLTPQPYNKFWVSFQPWLTKDNSPCRTYLQCLLTYFSIETYSQASIKIQRTVQENPALETWQSSDIPLTNCELVCPSYIGKLYSGDIEIDFANKDIGFGPGGTQEEILFGMTPEACPAVLITPTLGDHECVMISGVRRVGDWSGYGWDVRWHGQGDMVPRTILCMDALELEDGVAAQHQAGGTMLVRELGKCYSGFSRCQGEVIATGAWGCGAF